MMPFKYGSGAYCERPSQLPVEAPTSDGCSVIAVLVPAETPSTYKAPVYVAAAPSTTARWCQTFNDKSALPLICCSAVLPALVMAKRTTLVGVPKFACVVRN